MNRLYVPIAVVFGSSSLLLLDSALKGAAILVIATCAAMLLKRDSAATRHLAWLVAVVALLVVPLLSMVLPQWRVLPAWAAIPIMSPDFERASHSVELPAPLQVSHLQNDHPTVNDFPSEEFDQSFSGNAALNLVTNFSIISVLSEG